MEEYRRDAESASIEENVIGLYDKELEDKMIQEAINNRLLQEGKTEGLKEGKLEGLKEGKIEGLKEGKLEGKIEGLKEGKLEGIISVAKEMLKSNVSISEISRYTGLSKQEIENANR